MTTPLRRQYLEIKRRYPHAILFFRLGDFYETFDEDAETVARELEITLTSRPMSKGERVPLAGVPYHALDSYLAKLIGKGYKVAICEQMEEPAKGKKIVERQVVRVVTPGTLVEDNLLESGSNNYLAALAPANGISGLAYVDISTGEFSCFELDSDGVAGEIGRLQPAELLFPKASFPPNGITATLTPLGDDGFDRETATRSLLGHFGSATLDGLGLAGLSQAAVAAGVIIAYLQENQPAVLAQVSCITCSRPGAYMTVDDNTRRNLEIFNPLRQERDTLTLLSVLDRTKTAMGARLLRNWLGSPLLDVREIQRRQDNVQLFFDSAIRRGRTLGLLGKIPDVERLLTRISAAANATLTPGVPRDLAALRQGLEATPPLAQAINEGSVDTSSANELTANLHPCREAVDLIAAAIADAPEAGAVIRRGFSEELDGLRAVSSDARQFLADLERRERERTGIKSLKVGYNRVFGYYIEISKANTGSAPADYQRRQTLVNGERYTMPELQEHEYKVLHAQEMVEELEQTLLRKVCYQVATQGERIRETASAIAHIDVYCGLAEAAARNGYVRPSVDEGNEIDIRDGRHPVVERTLPEGTFVPNDIHLSSDDAQVIILTGPNMAGKSTYLRQAAVIVLMAQIGSFVPAAEARIGVIDRIFSRVGALDDIGAGQSTFMIEMLETATILHNATPRSLLIFDEIGRGTSTYDGMAIAQAVVEFIHNSSSVGAKTLFATHYHEMVELAAFLPRVRNYNVAVTEEQGQVVFLHRILPGGADRSYGVHVAQLAGLPKPVTTRAREILEELEARRETTPRKRRTEDSAQLSLMGADSGLKRELSELDIDGMTPLQAMTKLYQLVEKARQAAV